MACAVAIATEPSPTPPSTVVFGGSTRPVPGFLRNASPTPLDTEVSLRVLQTASTTARQQQESIWKRIVLPPLQTAVASAKVTFPVVRVKTRFLVQWITEDRRVLATTDIAVHPGDYLAELGTLAGNHPLAILDPAHQIKTQLRLLGIGFVDLEQTGLEHFEGRLAILGPFTPQAPMPDDLAHLVLARCKRDLAVVWIEPPASLNAAQPRFAPSFHTLRLGRGTVVIAQNTLVEDLPNNPVAHQNLVHLARQAVRPQDFGLPRLDPFH